jgi:hypothetical protein
VKSWRISVEFVVAVLLYNPSFPFPVQWEGEKHNYNNFFESSG